MVARTSHALCASTIALLIGVTLSSAPRSASAQQTQPGTPIFEAVGFGALRPWSGQVGSPRAVAKREADAGGEAELSVVTIFPSQLERWKVTSDGVPYFVGLVPRGTMAATWADMDGDGVADLICSVGRQVEIFTMGPNGLIMPGPQIPLPFTSGTVSSLAVADVNSDGLPDIGASASSSGRLAWLLNQGAGVFIPVSGGDYFGRLIPVQLGSDSFVDLVDWATWSGVGVSYGTGTGVFPTPTTYLVTTAPPLVSDLDHDGLADIIAGRILYRGVAGGPPAQVDTVATNPSAIVDMDHDGILDLVSIRAGKVGVARGLGGFEFAPETQVAAGTIDDRYGWGTGDEPQGPFGMSATMDANGDGWVDVLGTSARPAGIYPPDISGRVLYSIPARPGGGFRQMPSVATGSDPVQVALSDVLGADGRMDLIVLARGARRLEIHPGIGNGTFAAAQHHELPAGGARFALADLNADSYTDVVVACDSSSTLRVFPGAAGGLQAPFDLTAAGPLSDILIGDVDEDGHLDLLAKVSGYLLAAWRGDSVMGFAPVAWDTSPGGVGGGCWGMGDVDGDGHLDLVAVANTVSLQTYVLVHRGDGLGRFTRDTQLSRFGPCGGTPIKLGDLMGDGRTYVACATVDSARSTYSYFQAYTVEAGVKQFIPRYCEPYGPCDYFTDGHQIAPNPRQLEIADVTGDQVPDVLVLSAAGNVLTVLPGLGGGHFGTQIAHIVGRDPSSFALGDVDGDGDLDLVVADLATDNVTLMRHLGGATVGPGPAPADRALRLFVESAPNAAQLRLRLALPNACSARVEFFDLLGRRLLTLPVEASAPGEQSVTVDGSRLPRSGVVFARLTQGSDHATTRLARFD